MKKTEYRYFCTKKRCVWRNDGICSRRPCPFGKLWVKEQESTSRGEKSK